jgi:hypothetical protein
VHELLRELADLGGDGRAEEGGLAAHRRAPQDGLDVLEEAEVEHLVGLVEHDVAHPVEEQVVAIHHVHHPSDGTDRHVRLLQPGGLVPDRRAAEDGDDLDALALAVGPERLGDLDAELPGRGEHERLDLLDPRVDVLDHRQPERGGLAGAGLRLTDHVASLEQRRDGLLLDRGRPRVPQMGERLDGGLGEPELGKRGHARPTRVLAGRRAPAAGGETGGFDDFVSTCGTNSSNPPSRSASRRSGRASMGSSRIGNCCAWS